MDKGTYPLVVLRNDDVYNIVKGGINMKRKIEIVGAPMDLGQLRRGVDMGPSAIRYADVIERLVGLGYEVDDLGDIKIGREQTTTDPNTGLRNLEAVVQANMKLAEKVDEIMQNGSFPLVFGGDHSIAIGTLAGVSKYYKNLGLIWFDAHGDINTPETSPSGNIHGMPLAVNLGLGEKTLTGIGGYSPQVNFSNVVIIGARDLDEGERAIIKEKGIKIFTMHEIDRLGMSKVMDETINYLQERTDGVHLSLDLDGLDPLYAPGVGTPVVGGLSYRESHFAMEMLSESKIITSAEFVEVNPILDERNKTGLLAVGLIASLFGESLI